MLNFTIETSQPNPTCPYTISKAGTHSGDPEKCELNGKVLNVSDRVAVRGVIPVGSPIKLYQDWAVEFAGKEPSLFTTVLSSWYEKAEIETGTSVHWIVCLDWDGYSLTAFPEPNYISGLEVLNV